MNILLAEDVFKATIKSPDVVASQELWLAFFNDVLMPNFYYSNNVGDVISLPVFPNTFYRLIISFMECEDINKVCEFFKTNFDLYFSEQELEPSNVLIKVSENIKVYEQYQW